MFNFLKEVFKSEYFAKKIFWIRLKYFTFKKKIKTLDSEDAFSVTVPHNRKALKATLNRMGLLIRPLSILENVRKDSKILVIGPRNEWDFFLLWLSGFSFKNCFGLDLISYSPKIILGDMHKMPFDDCSFDVVLCGWTLSYSANPTLAALEIDRICKRNGVIGIGVEFSDSDSAKKAFDKLGYAIQEKNRFPDRINSTDMILDLFPCEKDVFFIHDAPLKNKCISGAPSNCAVVFEKK